MLHLNPNAEDKLVTQEQVGSISAGELNKFIAGAHFPADKNDLVNYAKGKGAPETILALVNSIPPRHYESVTDLVLGIRDSRH